jgi:type II secretory ATPase GspE/PulE/Tfp pilus assembly ATPase PilB-like protein
MTAAIVSRIKIMARLDIAERRLPQDGRSTTELSSGTKIDVRVTTVPTVHGEAASVRLMTQQSSELVELNELEILPTQLQRLAELIHRPWGEVLVTGPTGSGKTTTLYAMLNELNDPTRNILTVEDPVERRLEGIKQVQVNTKAGLGFATALRAFLRSDPDVILVGEIRDFETATISADASMTGHVVLSSLHTNNAASAPQRLMEIGLQPFQVTAGLVGVVAQRLVRRLCDRCKSLGAPTLTELKEAGIPDRLLKDDGSFPFWRPVGCPACGHSGYRGRFAVQEVMTIDDTIKSLISERAPVRDVEAAAVAAGMWTLKEDALRKAAVGLSSVPEVLRVVL